MIETFITEVNPYIFQFQLKVQGKIYLVHHILKYYLQRIQYPSIVERSFGIQK